MLHALLEFSCQGGWTQGKRLDLLLREVGRQIIVRTQRKQVRGGTGIELKTRVRQYLGGESLCCLWSCIHASIHSYIHLFAGIP